MRPRKARRIRFNPKADYFKPQGVPFWELEEITLSYEEAEAIRLRYIEGLNQEEAAEKMKISRSTFQRTLQDALKKIAKFIVEGKALKVERR